MNRAVLIDRGTGDPDYTKLKANVITRSFFDIRDARLSKAYWAEIGDRGQKAGVFAAWNWDETKNLSGGDFARWVALELAPLRMSNTVPAVQLDDETHDPARLIDMLTSWRKVLPNQSTSWTLESFQGGWFTPELVQTIVKCKIRVVIQMYHGNMEPIASDQAAIQLIQKGVPASLVSGYYDAANLPDWWGSQTPGWAFTQGRLP